MIRELQRRLTVSYTVATGIILSLVVISLSFISQMDLTRKTEEAFQSHVMSISTKLQTETFFKVSWLASTEADNGLIIHIEENGKPLLYHGSWQPPSGRQALIAQAREQARLLGTDLSVRPVSSASISPVFSLKGKKDDQYKAMAVSYPTDSGYKSMILLYYITPALNRLKGQRLIFIAADIIGIAALYLTAGKFVRKAVSPIQTAQEKQRQFVAAASHELRSPLMVIQSSAQAIEAVPEKTGQFTQNIRRECKRMRCLIDDMLLLASFDAHNWSVSLRPLDINMLLIDFYDLYEPLCSEKKVSFQLLLPDDMLPQINGDRERLFQILSILMDNALAYSRSPSAICLEAGIHKSVYKNRQDICIRVVDHGQGIADEDKERIFDRFYRADQSRKDKQHFGLGLSIAKELVFLHHGTIRAQDTPGGGCTIVLKLPVLSS